MKDDMERNNRIERSEAWKSIYKVVKQIPRKDVSSDAMDAPSATTEIEGIFLKLLTIPNVKVRFFLKIKRRDNTCNGNGYGIWNLDWAWFRKRGNIRLWTQSIGNGDNGERCIVD